MRVRRVLVAMAGFVALASGCVPAPGPGTTDTLDLGGLGRYSEPAYDVSATAVEAYSPRGPRTVTLTITARDSAGNVARSFIMREDNVSEPVTLASVGSFPGIFAPPHTRDFTLSGAPADPSTSTFFGAVEISELSMVISGGNAGGPIYDVTRLRATFRGLCGEYGVVAGSFTIG